MTIESQSQQGPSEHDFWWSSVDEVLSIHSETMLRHGDTPVHCEEAKVEGAIRRPLWCRQYEAEDLSDHELAAHLAASIADSHAFFDGNKRTALTTLGVFLQINGYDFTISTYEESVARRVELIVCAYQDSEDKGLRQVESLAQYLVTITILRR